MSNDKKTAPSTPDLGEGIPVRELRFSRPNGVETPIDGNHVSKIVTGEQWNGSSVVTYYPRIRHHQIAWTRGEGDTAQRKVFYLPESWCTWLAT